MPTLTKWAIEKDKAVVEGVGQGAPTAMAFLIYLDMSKAIQERDSMIFYRSFYEAIEQLPDKEKLDVYSAIFNYSLNFKEPDLSGISKTIFTLIRPQLEANRKRYLNGKQPKEKQSRSKTEAKQKQDESKTEANKNKNVNLNLNLNEHNNDFDFFWNQYHDITSMPKTDKEPALKHWKKLTEVERNLAIEKITDYYHSVENKKYVKKARTYLADKSFNDEHVNAEKKEEQYPDAVKMLAALGGYGPSIYPAIMKRLHEVQYKSEFGFDGILKLGVMAVENFIERGVNAYTWKAIESIDDPELRRDFRNRVKSHGYEAIHQRMVKKYLNETN